MNSEALLAGIRAGNYHEGGILCLRLLELDDECFAALGGEVSALCEQKPYSDVRQPDHTTNWTRPRGNVFQYSLLNLSGRTDDFSRDHDLSSFGKKFHFGAEFPVMARIVDSLPDLANFRVNVLGPGAQLAAHEEHSIVRTQAGSVGACIRCHLPVETNPNAELMLDGRVFHLEAGSVYLVNHGCVHSARNRHTNRRVHLVWDQLLTQDVYDALFGDSALSWAKRLEEDAYGESPLRHERLGAHLRLPQSVERDGADKLALSESQ